MIERRAEGSGRRSRALWSDCGAYRYLLERDWVDGGRLLYLLLNPSTATEAVNDPTVARCEARARALGFGGFAVANLFAFCATRPRDLFAADDPVGPDNDGVLDISCATATAVLCGWGAYGAHRGRGAEVAARLRDRGVPLLHLGLTAGGAPRHPLYVAYARRPAPWPA